MKVAVVSYTGESSLVQWEDTAGVHRAFIPRSEVKDGIVAYEILSAGIPYGEAWELRPLGCVGAERVAAALRRHGIWTREDARNVSRVRAALAEAYTIDLTVLLESIRGER